MMRWKHQDGGRSGRSGPADLALGRNHRGVVQKKYAIPPEKQRFTWIEHDFSHDFSHDIYCIVISDTVLHWIEWLSNLSNSPPPTGELENHSPKNTHVLSGHFPRHIFNPTEKILFPSSHFFVFPCFSIFS